MEYMRKVGRTVYTINNQTGAIDEWKCTAVLPAKDDLLCQLVRGKQTCFLPERCVFLSEVEAKIIAEKYK